MNNIDQVAARELQLWGENTQEIYNIFMGIVRGVEKAQKNGTFNDNKLNAACTRLVGAVLKSYRAEFGTFYVNYETRQEVARNFKEQVLEEIKERNSVVGIRWADGTVTIKTDKGIVTK